MAKIDKNTVIGLDDIVERLEMLLDHVIIYRQSTIYKREYRVISKRIEQALTAINEALDKYND